MASLTLLDSAVDREMESFSRKSSFGSASFTALDLSKKQSLRRSPTVEVLSEDLPRTPRTSSLASLISVSMQISNLPRLSIGSLFSKDGEEVQSEEQVQEVEEYSLNRDSGPHDEPNEVEETQNEVEETLNEQEEIQKEAEETQNELEETQNEVEETQNEVEETRNEVEETQNDTDKTNNDEENDVTNTVDEVPESEVPSESEVLNDDSEERMHSENDEDEVKDNPTDNDETTSEVAQVEEPEARNEDDVEMSEDDRPTYRGPPPIEVAISFDTTGSMSSLLDPLRDNITHVCERLFADVPNLRIAIVAHGDYCDENEFYLMKAVDFTQDFGALRTFLTSTEGTGGGDFAECYEYVLSQVGQLSWTPGTQRALIMIGDAVPHEVGSPDNKMGLDWRQEVSKLYHQMGINVYAVQCKEEEGAESFWRELAERASGKYLQLSEFDNVVQLIMAICYREKDPMMFGAFEHEVRHNVGPHINKDLHNMFNVLRDGPTGSTAMTPDDAVPGTSYGSTMRSPKRKRKADDSDTASPAKKVRKSPMKAKKVIKSPAKAKKSVVAATASVKKAVKTVTKFASSDRTTGNRKRYLRHQKGRLVGGRVARERVPETRFLLGDQAWSPWKMAVADQPQDSTWVACRDNRTGFRSTKLFKKDTRVSAIYEFAVQPAASRKRYPVYLRATTGIKKALRLDTYFLKNETLLDLTEEAIQKGYKLFVRRLPVKTPISVKSDSGAVSQTSDGKLITKMLFKEYDYAWNINVYGSSGARLLKL